jgi:hypothetical protein
MGAVSTKVTMKMGEEGLGPGSKLTVIIHDSDGGSRRTHRYYKQFGKFNQAIINSAEYDGVILNPF